MNIEDITRRGVISMWNPSFDNVNHMEKADIPCNIALA